MILSHTVYNYENEKEKQHKNQLSAVKTNLMQIPLSKLFYSKKFTSSLFVALASHCVDRFQSISITKDNL